MTTTGEAKTLLNEIDAKAGSFYKTFTQGDLIPAVTRYGLQQGVTPNTPLPANFLTQPCTKSPFNTNITYAVGLQQTCDNSPNIRSDEGLKERVGQFVKDHSHPGPATGVGK